MRRTLPLLALLLTACPAAGPELDLSPGERAALGALELALRVEEEHGDRIWPGYSLLATPLLIHRPGGRGFLVAAPPSVSGTRARLRGLPGVPPVIPIDPAEVTVSPSVTFSRDVPVRGTRAFLLRHTDGTPQLRWFRLLVHELFHEWQSRSFAQSPGNRLCRYPLEDLGNAARALVEQEALAAALEAPVEDAAAGLRRVLGLRLGRYSSSPDGDRIRIIEDWEERLEGTAKFVEERFVAEAGLAGEGQAALLDLARRLRSLAPEDLQKWRYYRTGEGLLRLLERLPEGPGWHHAVELGAAPSDAALERMARDPPEPLEPEEAALEAARRRVEPRIRAALAEEERLLAEWPRQGSLHVVLVADSGAAVNYSARGVTFHLPDCSRFIGHATAFVDRRAGLEVRDRSVLLDADRDVARYRVEFFGDPAEGDFLLVDDAPPQGPGPHPFSSSIRIRGSGWKLDHHGAGSLEVLPDGLRIDLLLESGAS